MTTLTRGQKTAADVASLLRARNPLIWITTREEARVEAYILEAAAAASYVARTWDVAAGIRDFVGRSYQQTDPGAAIEWAANRAASGPDRGVLIMRDLGPWLQGPAGALTVRQLRNLARALPASPRDRAQAVIVLSPSSDMPPEIAAHATVLDWPLPDREEIAGILDAAISALPDELRDTAAPNGTRDAAIDAAIGLTGEEAASCYARSLVTLRRIDPATVANEKRRVIAREKVLEWFEPLAGGIDAVGGLDLLKAWLASRRQAYSSAARAYGLPSPKGALLVGVPGCGKSLTAKAVATAWGVPLLRLDMGALRSKFVGESEGNLRKAFGVIEAIGRCVVWIDEVEKAMAGATQGAADGGVSADALGAVLSWMQERQGDAFVIATANDAAALPPELLRKGRFDEVWFVNMPTAPERAAILGAALRSHGRGALETIDREAVAAACEGFTGSEVAELVPDALFQAFGNNAREIETRDLLAAARTVVPLSKTAAEKIAKLREWAESRARPASAIVETAERASAGRQLDI